MALGTEVGLGPCYIVLDDDPDPSSSTKMGTAAPPPLFGPRRFGCVCCGETVAHLSYL